MLIQGKAVLVTGAAKGIGRYIAHSFLNSGAKVAIVDLDAKRLRRTLRELRSQSEEVIALEADVRNEGDVAGVVEKVSKRFKRIDVLVNNAGIVPHFAWGVPRWSTVLAMDKDFWANVIDTNLGGTYVCTKQVLPIMEKQRSGHIINLYGAVDVGSVRSCAYAVSKEAIKTFTRYVAEEVRQANVCVLVMSPGGQPIATEDAPEEARQRLPSPEIIAGRFILAASAGMDLSGQLVAFTDGYLEPVQ
jgi:3-oxoacyl-[acyl-carrier protein] reductase